MESLLGAVRTLGERFYAFYADPRPWYQKTLLFAFSLITCRTP